MYYSKKKKVQFGNRESIRENQAIRANLRICESIGANREEKTGDSEIFRLPNIVRGE